MKYLALASLFVLGAVSQNASAGGTSTGVYNPLNNYAVNQANQQNYFSSSNFYGQPGPFQQPSYSYVNSFWQPYTTAYNTGYNTGYAPGTTPPMNNGYTYQGYNQGYNQAYNPGYNSFGYNTGYAGQQINVNRIPGTQNVGQYATPGTYNQAITNAFQSPNNIQGPPTPAPGAFVVPGSTQTPGYTPNGYYQNNQNTGNTGSAYYGAQNTNVNNGYNAPYQYTGYTGYNNHLAYNQINGNSGYNGAWNTGYNNQQLGTVSYNTGYNTGFTETGHNQGRGGANTCFNSVYNSYGPCPTNGAPIGGGNYNNSPPNTLFTFNDAKSSSFSPGAYENTMSGLYGGGSSWVPQFTRP